MAVWVNSQDGHQARPTTSGVRYQQPGSFGVCTRCSQPTGCNVRPQGMHPCPCNKHMVSRQCKSGIALWVVAPSTSAWAPVRVFLQGTISEAMVREAVLGVHVPPFEPREGVQIAVEEGGSANTNRARASGSSSEEKGGAQISNDSLQELISELPTPGDLAGYQLTALEVGCGCF